VLLAEPEPTPYDLRWRMFGIPVRVHPLFWLVTVVLGWTWSRLGFGYLALWVGCVFTSILLHELGHVWMGQAFGSRGHIVLFSFGGLAIGSKDVRRRWQRVAVSFAGPGIQLVLYGVLWFAASYLLPAEFLAENRPVRRAIGMLLFINLFWPILNLLPIWPLDGGQITREVLEGASPQKGLTASLVISATVSGLLAVFALALSINENLEIPYMGWLRGNYFMALFYAMFCASSIQELQQVSQRRQRWDDDLPWMR
jgi:Zn-dependent protease